MNCECQEEEDFELDWIGFDSFRSTSTASAFLTSQKCVIYLSKLTRVMPPLSSLKRGNRRKRLNIFCWCYEVLVTHKDAAHRVMKWGGRTPPSCHHHDDDGQDKLKLKARLLSSDVKSYCNSNRNSNNNKNNKNLIPYMRYIIYWEGGNWKRKASVSFEKKYMYLFCLFFVLIRTRSRTKRWGWEWSSSSSIHLDLFLLSSSSFLVSKKGGTKRVLHHQKIVVNNSKWIP